MNQIVRTLGSFLNRAKYTILLTVVIGLILMLSAYFGSNLFFNQPNAPIGVTNQSTPAKVNLHANQPDAASKNSISSEGRVAKASPATQEVVQTQAPQITSIAKTCTNDTSAAAAARDAAIAAEIALHEQKLAEIHQIYLASYAPSGYPESIAMSPALRTEGERYSTALALINAQYPASLTVSSC